MGPAIAQALADPLVVEVMVNPDGVLRLDRLAKAGRRPTLFHAGEVERSPGWWPAMRQRMPTTPLWRRAATTGTKAKPASVSRACYRPLHRPMLIRNRLSHLRPCRLRFRPIMTEAQAAALELARSSTAKYPGSRWHPANDFANALLAGSRSKTSAWI